MSNPSDNQNRSLVSTLEEILDQTQGHLIIKWESSRSANRLRQIGLSSLYCLLAVIFLIAFAVESFFQGRIAYGSILLLFAGLIVISYFFQKATGNRKLTNTFLVLLFGIICLFLFYTGGEDNSGPLWYFVFPIFALYIQRLWAGIFSTISLFIITLVIILNPVLGLNPVQYSVAFLERFLAVYIAVSIMSFLYAYLRAVEELEYKYSNNHLKKLAATDDLTKVPNRRGMEEILKREISRTRRSNSAFCVVMVDLDRFKNVNDTYGHACGDKVLKDVVQIIKKSLRSQDICARWGGEEFLLLLPETKIRNATAVIERLRQTIEENTFEYLDKQFKVTSSFGIYQFESSDTLNDCIRGADIKLYAAKTMGRNRVVS